MLELAGMELGENEIWDRSEAYMINVVEPGSLYDRLRVMVYMMEYKEDIVYIKKTIKEMSLLFDFLDGNETFYNCLRMALAIGNIMNGGTPKGQCDGFDLSVMGKLSSTKDNNNKSMMAFIMKQLCEANPDTKEKFSAENKVFETKATDIDTLDRKYKEMNASWHEASGAQKAVTEAGEDSDTFTVKTTQQMKDYRAELD